MSEQRGPLAGLKVLIVEDEALIAIGLEEEIWRLGTKETFLAFRKQQALDAIAEFQPNFAVVDVSLVDDGNDYAIADALAEHAIPFVFSSGHLAGELPDRHVGRPFVGKPMQYNELAEAVSTALGRAFRAG